MLSLGSALLHLVRDKGESQKMARALTIRVGLSVLLFVLLMVAWWLGWIQPHVRVTCASPIAISRRRCSPSPSRSPRSRCSCGSRSGSCDRAAEKDALQAKYAAGQRTVVELTAANAAGLTQYQRVTARGHYDSAHQILLDSMPSAMGQPGYRVVTPFELEDGGWLLVDRGWRRPGATRSDIPDVAVGEAARTVAGQLSVLPQPGVRLSGAGEHGNDWPRVMNYPQQASVEKALERKVLPGLVLLDRDQPDGYERAWQARTDLGSERHLSYAVQWFGFAHRGDRAVRRDGPATRPDAGRAQAVNAPCERRSRAQIWIVVALFFAPLALAFLLYYGAAAGVRPAAPITAS